jgi:uncharacterized small protein (DUF1192 family)
MFDEEEKPKKSSALFIPAPPVLDRLSVDDLHEYTHWLEAEKSRVAQEIIRKQSANAAASALFKS